MQNELIINQNRHFSRVQAINAKILAKYSLNLVDLEQKALGKTKFRMIFNLFKQLDTKQQSTDLDSFRAGGEEEQE